MSLPLVSCVVPVFNGERFLADALDSILAQSYRPAEVLVADDGSEDGTASVARTYGERVRYLFQSNQGASAARNLGLGAARGTFIAFLDADDLWHSDKLTRQLARFEARPELDYSVAHVQNLWVNPDSPEAARFRDHPRARPLPGYVTGTLVARGSLFDRIGPFDPEIRHADAMEWFLRARAAGAVGELLPDVLLQRRIHENNVSRVFADESRDEFFGLLKRQLDRVRSRFDVGSG